MELSIREMPPVDMQYCESFFEVRMIFGTNSCLFIILLTGISTLQSTSMRVS